jgi:NAD(P)-dependent dehydrogenase (short-subunit alcohol dehydrogenase family)
VELVPGKVAVVTGAASGLGRALANQIAERGLDVVLADIETEPLADAVNEIEAHGVAALGVPTDVADAKQVDALAHATLDRFGHVDLVVNDAGVGTFGAVSWDVPDNDWQWVISVVLGGVINGIKSFVPHLVAQGSGHVVNIASMASLTVTTRQAAYTAAKCAVAGLSETLRVELEQAAPGVKVTIVYPGSMGTNIPTSSRNRPAALAQPDYVLDEDDMKELMRWSQAISGPVMSAPDAAAIVVRAIEADAVHVSPNGTIAAIHSWIDDVFADLEG